MHLAEGEPGQLQFEFDETRMALHLKTVDPSRCDLALHLDDDG
jgi:hypothetical protein